MFAKIPIFSLFFAKKYRYLHNFLRQADYEESYRNRRDGTGYHF